LGLAGEKTSRPPQAIEELQCPKPRNVAWESLRSLCGCLPELAQVGPSGILLRRGEQKYDEVMVGFFDVPVRATTDKQHFFIRTTN
jgi:hypothetical protein